MPEAQDTNRLGAVDLHLRSTLRPMPLHPGGRYISCQEPTE